VDRSRWFVVAGRLIWAARLLDATFRLLRIVVRFALGLFALWAYIWRIYPSIPKSLGGGKATQVQLVIERKALPERGVTVIDNITGDGDTIKLDAWLFYKTADYIYLHLSSTAWEYEVRWCRV
jgi:hypothetical protein